MFKPRHIAQVCREGMGALSGHIRGVSIPHWDELNDRQRKMSVAVVNFILATPDATPEACHQLWAEKMQHEEGYVYGESRDETLKTHPDLVPFGELNPFSVAAYALSIGIVRGLQDIAHRYENCAAQPIEPPVVYAEHTSVVDVANAGNPHVLVTETMGAVFESLAAPIDEVIDKVVEDAIETLEPPIDKAVNNAVDGLSEPAVDVQ